MHLSVRPCVCPETLLTRYLAEYLTHFHQTYISDALWDIGECIKFWGQKVKVQGHSGVTYAETNRHCTGGIIQCTKFSDFNISQCSVAMRLRCGWIFNDFFIAHYRYGT